MRRLITLLTVFAVVAVLMIVTAVPAFAAGKGTGQGTIGQGTFNQDFGPKSHANFDAAGEYLKIQPASECDCYQIVNPDSEVVVERIDN